MLAKVNSQGINLFLEGNCFNQKGQTLGVKEIPALYMVRCTDSCKSLNFTDIKRTVMTAVKKFNSLSDS